MYSYEEIKDRCKYGSLSRQGLLYDLALKGEFESCFYVLDFADSEAEKSFLLNEEFFLRETISRKSKKYFLRLYKLRIENKLNRSKKIDILPNNILYHYPSFPVEWGYDIINYLLERFDDLDKIESDYRPVLKLFMRKMENDFGINKKWLKKLVKQRKGLNFDERYYLEKFLTRGLVNEEIKGDWNKLNQIKQTVEECKNCGYYNDKGSSYCDLCETQFPRNCLGCGYELKPENNFCPNCGEKTT